MPTPDTNHDGDREADACVAIAAHLKTLDGAACSRVLSWAYSRFAPARDPQDSTRTFSFWLEDLPSTGDVVHIDGFPCSAQVSYSCADGRLTYHLEATAPATETNHDPAPGDPQ